MKRLPLERPSPKRPLPKGPPPRGLLPQRLAGRAALALLLATPSIVFAHAFRIGDLTIDHPWVAPPPPGAPNVAGYLSVTNDGERADRLLGATAAFTDTVQVHESRIEDDVVSMRELRDGVPIPAGKTVVFEPTGRHLMFVAPEPLLEGDVRPVTLRFERAGEIEVRFNVEQPGEDVETVDHSTMEGMGRSTMEPGEAGGGQGMNHDDH